MEVCGVPGYLLYSPAALAIGSRTMLLADHNASRTVAGYGAIRVAYIDGIQLPHEPK
jgi:hypothetical protein